MLKYTHILELQLYFCDKKMFDTGAIEKIKEKLIQLNEKVSVAESVTAGFLQAAIASADTALKFFEGGITAYNINQKVRHLHIDKHKAEECNCTSEQTANEMAVGVCQLFGTDWGISITGYNTAVPESDFRLFAYFSICRGKEIKLSQRIDLEKDEKPVDAQLKYVNTILAGFKNLLSGS